MISPTSTGSVALSLQWPKSRRVPGRNHMAPPRTRGPVGARVALLRRPLGALLGALVVAHADVVVAADRVQQLAADAAHGGLDAVRPQVGDDPDVRRRRGDGGVVDARLAVDVEREADAREARLLGLGPRAEPLRRARARREARRGLDGADLAHGLHERELEVRLAGRDVVLAAPLARNDLFGDVHERRLEQVRDPRRPAPRQLEEPSKNAVGGAARRKKARRGAHDARRRPPRGDRRPPRLVAAVVLRRPEPPRVVVGVDAQRARGRDEERREHGATRVHRDRRLRTRATRLIDKANFH